MRSKTIQQALIAVVVLLTSFRLASCGSGNHDSEIQTKIASLTQNNRELEAVTATVNEGVVTLVGQCKSEKDRERAEKDRERAEKDIKKIDDVKQVINNISVVEDLVITPDNELRDQVNKTIKKYKRVRADVNDGVVTVRGQIDQDELNPMMMDLNALRPRRVDNQLVVE